MKMNRLILTLLLNAGLIFTLATALITNKDIGNCSEATSHDGLMDIVEPLKYNIKFNFRLHYKNIIGKSNIRIRITKLTRIVALNADGLQIDHDTVMLTKFNKTWAEDARNGNGENRNSENNNGDIVVETYKPKSYRYCTASQILEIYFDRNIYHGYYVLHIPFTAPLSEFKGFIQYPYLNVESSTRWLIMTYIEANEARKLFPCWDKMAMKAFFNISIQHSSRYIVFSNTPIRYVEKDETNGIHITYFYPTAAISPSLVMITMINNIINHPIEFATNYVWHREATTQSLVYMRNIIETIKQYLSLATDVQEKKRKTNFILIPNNPMKSIGCCGLYLLREQDFMYDEKMNFSGHKVAIANILARSVSRRWFLGVVSPFWQTDFWLGESLAIYFSHYTIAKMLQNMMYVHLFVVQTLQPVLHYDTELKMQSIIEIAKSTFDINANEIDTILYSCLNYNKGSVLIRMLQNFLGEANFRNGIDRYVRKYKSSSATTDNFWQIMQEIFDESDQQGYDIKEMMDTWLTQRQYPIVYFDYNYTISMAKISVSCNNDNDWIIPISFTVMSNFVVKNSANLKKARCSQNIIVKDFQLEDMIIINENQVGYYRVNYDNKGWRKISSHLRYGNYSNIHVLNRAAFIDDAYYFMVKGELDTSVFFDIIKYLKREMDFVAWYPMFNILSYMSDFLKQAEETFVVPHMLEILNALLKNVGYKENPKDDDMTKSLRLLAIRWACKLGHEKCLKFAKTKLKEHIMDPVARPILPWWKDWVYCMGMETANMSIWNQVLDESKRNKDLGAMMYLTCTNEISLLSYYLDFFILKSEAKKLMTDYERFSIYRAIIKKHVQKNMMLGYILQNYKKIISSFSTTKTTIFGDVIMSLRSSEQFDQITQLAKSFSDDDQFVIQQLIQVRTKQLIQIMDKYSCF